MDPKDGNGSGRHRRPATTPLSLNDRDGLVLVQRSTGAGVQATARAGDEETALCAGKECVSHIVIGATGLSADFGREGEPVVAECEARIEHERVDLPDHGVASVVHFSEVPKSAVGKRSNRGLIALSSQQRQQQAHQQDRRGYLASPAAALAPSGAHPYLRTLPVDFAAHLGAIDDSNVPVVTLAGALAEVVPQLG